MSNVKKDLISGVFYTALAKYSGIIISLVVTAILARLLSPEEFGIVAIATVIIIFFTMFCDLGIAPAIVQSQNLDDKDLSTLFSLTFWIGITLTAGFFFSSVPISNYYEKEILIPLCRILSINLLFASLNIVPNALLYKHKEFKFISYRTLIVQGIAGVFAVSGALCGLGIYSLLINPIASSIVLFILSFIKYPQRFTFSMQFSSIKKVFSFSIYQFFFNVINYFSRNMDKLLIGKYLGMNPLGFYEKSYRLMMLPMQNITQIITPVMHPIFAEFQNDFKQLDESYQKIIKLMAFIGFPLSVLLLFTSRELVLIVFGNQWLPSIRSFQILSLSVGVQIILSTSGSIFQAANSTKIMFLSGLLSTILTIGGILIGIFYFKTIEGVAGCVLVSFLINFIQCYLLLYKVTLKLPIKFFVQKLLSPSILSGICIIPLFFLDKYTTNWNIIITFGIKCSVCLAICLTYVQLHKDYDIVGFIKNKLHKS